ncbi:MAG: 6-carboxytetrahydropterin synthase [Bdellovibrionota bacterium]
MKIFVQDATLLDCALFLSNRGPTGKSWAVDVYWSGDQDEQGMLFDFALAKKSAKQTIDHEFDHKILVKSSQIRHQTHSQIILADSFQENNKEHFFALNTYNNSVKKISRETLKALENDDLSLLEKDIAQDILRNSPQNIKEVQVKLRQPTNAHSTNYYTYTHSLCSHIGNCQRFHGHSSFIEVYKKNVLDEEKSKNLAQFLNNKYIISHTYLKENWNCGLIQDIRQHCLEVEDMKDSLVALEYSGTQGQIGILISKEKVVPLDFESTVENIARFARWKYAEEEGIEVRAYEGLCKGAIYP